MNTERRLTDRLARVFPVYLRCAQETLEVHALDVSPTGVRILTPGPLQESDRFHLELELEPDLRLDVTGQPVWQQELNRAGHCVVGLCFSEASPRLESWLEEQRAAA